MHLILMLYRDFFTAFTGDNSHTGIKCFPHKCHPSIFHLHLEDTNVALVNGKIVACTSEQKASLRLS